jgi:ketosteroid isomerase-like protein
MVTTENGKLVLDVFRAIEQRNNAKFRELLDPKFEIHWPASLPYGGRDAATWSETWGPLQPTEAERKMDPRVIAESKDEVVVLWQQRGVSPSGKQFEGEVLGLYRVRDGNSRAHKCSTSTPPPWPAFWRKPEHDPRFVQYAYGSCISSFFQRAQASRGLVC